MSERALVVIDYAFDFVWEEGALTCGKPAQKILGGIRRLIQEFRDNHDYIVIANDIHQLDDPYHPETGVFPPHMIEGTKGREPYLILDLLNKTPKSQIHWIDKTRYSAFAGTDLELRLREREIKEVHLVGVCTDICILHTAVDAYNKGFKIVVHEDGVASFNKEAHVWALEHFKNVLNAKVLLDGVEV